MNTAPKTDRCPASPPHRDRPIHVGIAPTLPRRALTLYRVDGVSCFALTEDDAIRTVRMLGSR